MCSYVLTRIQGSSRSPSSSDQRGSGRRAKREANGNATGVQEGGGGGKRERECPEKGRIAPGLCSHFLARRRTCSRISNRVLSSLLCHGPLLTLPSANSLTYAGTYVYSPFVYIYSTLRMNTNAPCPAKRITAHSTSRSF